MAGTSYKLSVTLYGHTSDVRAVAAFADGTIVSASRDKTARIWKPSGTGTEYIQTSVLKDHSNYVSSVCILNPTKNNPKGFIITGSSDKTICVYAADETKPTYIIKSHKDTVCNLRAGNEEGTFLSSSWDQTAKLWHMSKLSEPKLTLQGHTASVWCVANLSNNAVVTGSADKLVIVWTKNGTIEHKLSGHEDCVRDIAPIKDNEFLTCANDATVRHWNSTLGTCLGTYSGHENYIYSVSAVLDGSLVFTSGEDRTVRVWCNGELSQTMHLPTQSVWCTAAYQDGDVIAGSSDGAIRIFTKNPQKYASAEILQQYDDEVTSANATALEQIGGVKVKDLPDKKALEEPGQKDGQTKMIKEGKNIKAYSWSQSEQKWVLIGDVMGGSGGNNALSGKQLFNGREYDYVFSVDIKDGAPPLKLPYNMGEDPWTVAQKFLHDNDLSQLFLDQVANFIITNSKPAPTLNTSGAYVDPFTGTSRYVPGGGSSSSSTENPLREPFVSSSNTSVPRSSYIPQTNYLKLEQANLSAIADKLLEFNSKPENNSKATTEEIKTIVNLVRGQTIEDANVAATEAVKHMLSWPNDIVFPVLDISRLAVLRKDINDLLCTEDILDVIRKHIKPDSLPSNQMLIFRLMANMFNHEAGERLCLDYRDEVLKALLDLDSLGSKHNQIAISTYILNLTVALNKQNDTSGRTKTLNVILTLLPRVSESEALFRILVALGTTIAAIQDPEHCRELITAVKQSEETLRILRTVQESGVECNAQNKLANCSKEIMILIF